MNKTNAPDFTTTILVGQTPEEAYKAINNVRGWWSENVEGSTDTLHVEFLYHYKDVHICKIKVVELIPGQKVVWQVLKNHFSFIKDQSEWTGTRIVFDIAKKGDKTEVRFTHEGLVPAYECYQICNDAWTGYIQKSLFGLITTGKGNPTTKENDTFNVKLIAKWL